MDPPSAPFLPLDREALPGYLWLAGAVLLLAALLAAFACLFVRRRHDGLAGALTQLYWLSARVPRLWRFVRHRFSRGDWHGLALTSAAVLCVLATYLFALVTESWTDREALYHLDHVIQRALAGAFTGEAVTALHLITYAGDVVTVTAVSLSLAVVFWYRRARWRLLALALAVGGGQAVVWSLKWIFARPRPGAGLAHPVGAAFPSGHTFAATVLYGFLIFLLWRSSIRPMPRYLATAVLGLLILGVGLSRVLLSVHWVSDVIGGFLIGTAWLLASLTFTRALQAYRAPRRPMADGG